MKFNFKMDSIHAIMARHGIEKGGMVQKYVDNEVLRLDRPYVPMQQGTLQQSGDAGTDVGSGEVVYNAPYARYQYYGKVMVGRAPKTVTDRDLTYHGSPKRGAQWFERMKEEHKGDILRGAARIAGGKAK